MIVTRQRRRRSPVGRVLVMLAVPVAIVAALLWPPSQRAIANGPLKPVWTAAGRAGNVAVRPLTFAGQQQTIVDRNREIRDLNARLEQQRVAKADLDGRAARLQQQVTALANQPRVAPATPAPRPAPSAASAFGSAAGPAAAAPTADQRRLAATWAAMDPEKAAAVVQRLPDDQVTPVLGAMDADAAGAIMNALPANVAVRISRAVAQVQPAARR